MPETIVSRPYHPQMACERCVFGTGKHSDFCEVATLREAIRADMKSNMDTWTAMSRRLMDCMTETERMAFIEGKWDVFARD